MWNEKEFFDDFVIESKKVEPDRDFVEHLKNMTNDMETDNNKYNGKRKNFFNISNYKMGYIVAAMILLVCVMAGGITWNIFLKSKSDGKNDNVSDSIHAGTQDKDIQSGTIGDKNGIIQAGLLMEDENIKVVDENGESISSAKRKILIKWLNMAQKTDKQTDLDMDYVSYFCEGDKTLEIRIYGDEEYIVIEGEDIIYEIRESAFIP